MVYIISCIMTMTYGHMTPLRQLYVTCITIIDTIIHHILHINTNNAYIYLVSMTMTYDI
jgi:hypothetical protein